MNRIKEFLRLRIFRWRCGLDNTKEAFWIWWLGMHPDYGPEDFWENIYSDPWVPECGTPPWDKYIEARHVDKEYFALIEAAQGSNVWGKERIERYVKEQAISKRCGQASD
jgi:hypothetical protein